jgi:hypothetical protein
LFSGAELWPALAPVLSLSLWQNTGAQTIPAEPKSMQTWDFFISFWKKVQKNMLLRTTTRSAENS